MDIVETHFSPFLRFDRHRLRTIEEFMYIYTMTILKHVFARSYLRFTIISPMHNRYYYVCIISGSFSKPR